MKAMAGKRVILTLLVIISQALAVHLMRVISATECVELRRYQPEDKFRLFWLDAESRKHIQYWQKRLTDTSLPVVGPCRIAKSGPHECIAPPLTAFPWSDSHRNKLLMRPPPDIVRANIQQASNGRLSTVEELVEIVNANLEDLSVLSDDELTLLGTNFAEPKAGLTVTVGCGPIHCDGWHEDLLVSQDEQRALAAGFLHAISDDGFFARRSAALHQAMQDLGYVHDPEPADEECEPRLRGAEDRFIDRVERLNAEVIISETEWLARYEEYVAALRAGIYAVAAGRVRDWEYIRQSLEYVVCAVEDIVEEMIERSIPMVELGFIRFLEENENVIRWELRELRQGIARRVAYRRWKMLKFGEADARIRSREAIEKRIQWHRVQQRAQQRVQQREWLEAQQGAGSSCPHRTTLLRSQAW